MKTKRTTLVKTNISYSCVFFCYKFAMSRFLKKASHSILFRTICDVCHAAQVKNDVKDAIDPALRAASKMIVALSFSLPLFFSLSLSLFYILRYYSLYLTPSLSLLISLYFDHFLCPNISLTLSIAHLSIYLFCSFSLFLHKHTLTLFLFMSVSLSPTLPAPENLSLSVYFFLCVCPSVSFVSDSFSFVNLMLVCKSSFCAWKIHLSPFSLNLSANFGS